MQDQMLMTMLGVQKTTMKILATAMVEGRVDPEALAAKFDEIVMRSNVLSLATTTTSRGDGKTARQRRQEFIQLHSKPVKQHDASVLGINGLPVPLKGFAERNAFVPNVGDDYVLRPEMLRIMVAWLLGGRMDSCLHFFGPTGCGKTTLPQRVAELLNIPVLSYTCHERTELADLIGHFVVNDNGGMVWKDGPITLAIQAGWWVMLNEIDYASPAVVAGLNDIMEGRGFYIPETSEFVEFHPDARILVTSNTSGLGDQTGGSYIGTQQQNLAFLDRLESVQVDYMDAGLEVKLVEKDLGVLSTLMPHLAMKLVNVAGKIRQQYMGTSGAQSAIEVTMSTRALRRWARNILLFKDWHKAGIDPIQYALGLSLTNKASAPTQQAIAAVVQLEVGAWSNLIQQPAKAVGA